MGYYSQAATTAEYTSRQPDFLHPQAGNSLRLRLSELQVQLEVLEAIRPHDRMHPLYDRFFYSDFACDEFPDTVQGLLQAIAEVKDEIFQQDILGLEEQRLLASIRNTGADQNGQVVFAAVFLPYHSVCA